MTATLTLNFNQSASSQRCKESFKLKPNEESLEFTRGQNWRTCSESMTLQKDNNLVFLTGNPDNTCRHLDKAFFKSIKAD